MPASNSPTIRIADADVQIVEYKGERVVTFKQIDEVHGRPDGTARRNFNENRDRFAAGEDYFELTADEIRTQSLQGAFALRTPKGIILTRRGYFLLCKSLNDDRAWAIHAEMVEAYFAVLDGKAAPALPAPKPVSAAELRRSHSYWLSIAERSGLDANAALFSANRMMRKATGVDVLAEMGQELLPAPADEIVLPPTAYCEALGVGRTGVNSLLCQHGYQTAERDHKDRPYYVLTSKGHDAGGRGLDRSIEHDKGTTMKVEIKWPRSIVDRLKADIASAGNILPA